MRYPCEPSADAARRAARRPVDITATSTAATFAIAAFAALVVPTTLHAQERADPLWQWSTERVLDQASVVRAGRDLNPDVWPGGARVAVLLSFDVDNETLYLDPRGPNIGALSEGEYGARVGLGRVLELLDRHAIPASFFIPAVSLELNPEMTSAILRSGRHEIGLHGWIHENNRALPDGVERELTERALRYVEGLTGEEVVGYRAPSWALSERTPSILRELGFLYDSSLMADDRPYELVAHGEPTGLVELPVTWILDDYPLLRPLGNRYSAPSDVLEVWKAEFDRAWEEGTMYILTMHPHVIGWRSRIRVLEELVEHIRGKGDDVWFGTHREAAEWVRDRSGLEPTPP